MKAFSLAVLLSSGAAVSAVSTTVDESIVSVDTTSRPATTPTTQKWKAANSKVSEVT